jgi:ABC-type transporter Mla subunit MlaD
MNKSEKKALLSIIVVIAFFCISVGFIGVKNNWFASAVQYKTEVTDAEGMRVGGLVTLSGLRVGEITKLKVTEENTIIVHFNVLTKFSNKMNEGTQARIIRAYIIGEKRIDIVPGDKNATRLIPGAMVEGIDSMEITDMISGKNMGSIMAKVKSLSKSVESLVTTFASLSKNITPSSMTSTWKQLSPWLKNTNKLAKSIQKDFIKNKLVKSTLEETKNLLIPLNSKKDVLMSLLDETNILVKQVGKHPKLIQDVSGVLKELIVTLRAAQKTWLLEDHVKKERKTK